MFKNHDVYHEQPGDISTESWGTVERPADINDNISDLGGERKAYESAKKLREGNTNRSLQEDYVQQILRYRAQTVAIQSKSAEKIRKAKDYPLTR